MQICIIGKINKIYAASAHPDSKAGCLSNLSLMKTIVFGGNGLTGTYLIEELIKQPEINKIYSFLRGIPAEPVKSKVEHHLLNLNEKLPAADAVFCCIGTTIKKAGSKENFYHADHDVVIRIAENARKAGCKKFIYVSSIGADKNSSNFYLKVKGQTEADLQDIGFDSLVILRPSMLLGKRKEIRTGEVIGKVLFVPIGLLMFGPLKKYRPIHAAKVARAMVREALDQKHKGVQILDYTNIM